MTEPDFVLNKELATNQEQNNHTGSDIGVRAVQEETVSHLGSAGLQECDQTSHTGHNKGIELTQPGDHNGGEALAAHGVGVDGVVNTGNQQHTGNAAQRAGDHHRPDNDLFHIIRGKSELPCLYLLYR